MWLKKEFISKDYVRAVSNYAAAFARRYKDLVKWYTPLNEPIVNALMCGKRGMWPPYLRGDAGYIRIMLQLVRGIIATVEAIKEVDPLSIMVHVEATGLSRAIRQDLESLAVEEQRRGYLAYDLLSGAITHDHPLFPWLIRSGASVDMLDEIARHKISLDVLGMNFYPQWSTQHLYVDPKGRLAYRAHEEDGAGFAAVVNDYYQRYKAPIIITETSAFGSEELRARWLKSSVEAVKYLRSQRVPVLGYTWFPMFTMIDWRYRHGQSPLDHYRLELGLYRLGDDPAGGRWIPTPLVEQVRNYIADSAESVGALDPSALAPALNTEARKAHSHVTPADAAAFTRQQSHSELVEGD
jgi:beta-glucosidase/6-phospho-beta-glucosidase/beta-galactosidase